MIDFEQPLRTKGGRLVTILTTDGREPYPVIGYAEGDSTPLAWTRTGHSSDRGDLDLLNAMDRPVVYLNVFENNDIVVSYPGEEVSEDGRIARIRFDFPENWSGRYDR